VSDTATPQPHPSKTAERFRFGAAIASGLLGGLVLLAYALEVEPYLLELTRPEIPLRRLPPECDGLKLLLLTDPHVVSYGFREQRLVELLADIEEPDLIAWGGDFIQGSNNLPDALQLVRDVKRLFPGVPTFFIPGNAEHKMRGYRLRAFLEELACTGMVPLVNRHVPFTWNGGTITLAGVDDPYYGHADLAAALDGAPDGRFTLLLAHSPQIAVQAARAGVDLMLSGHTHGGQVRLPLIGPLKTQNPLARGMGDGLWDRDHLADLLGFDPGGDLITYISRGIGVAPIRAIAPIPNASRFAPRFLCPPEVALITLRRIVEAGGEQESPSLR
jgi:uncharacterized protein